MMALGLTSALAVGMPVTAATFTVTNTLDAGPGSLRQAVLDANAAPGEDEILVASTVSGTVVLTSGPLDITDSVSIIGPGAEVLTVDGGGTGAIIDIPDELGWPPNWDWQQPPTRLTISGLTLAHATSAVDTVFGYGVTDVSVVDSVITGNSFSAINMGNGDLEIRNCELSDSDRGIRTLEDRYESFSPTVRIQDSVITGNRYGTDGCGRLDVSGTRITDNDLGIRQTEWYCQSDVSVTNSNISGNGGASL